MNQIDDGLAHDGGKEVSSLDSDLPPPRFESRKEFMDFLGELMIASFEHEEEEEAFEETRGRPRLLKTYMMEANQGLPCISNDPYLIVKKTETRLPEVTVLSLEYANVRARFYVDTSDRRFWLLHTNDLADNTRYLFNRLVSSPTAAFDKAWFPTETIQKIAGLPNNVFKGFGLEYQDFFALNGQGEQPVEELRMRVSGSNSIDALEALRAKDKLRRSLSYSMLRVRRGNSSSFVIEELSYEGRFIARGGSSIDDYVSLIEITGKMYRNTIEAIEKNSIGVKEVEGRMLAEGQAFDLILERKIENIDLFLKNLVNSKNPFRLWGMQNKISKDFYQIIGVDLHTGDSIDLEVTPCLIRVYLPKGSCGNTILRLYTNLQHYFDSAIRLNDEPLAISE